ncbi:beta strand repeat-containing protein [Serratia marcescens]|uniref:beta strand repeat-containing protein n=1 Tax=Serratia marcescens TaxID=615 RepID=UPI00148D6CD1|nr:DUF4214 domain-containing protein [Serratia marcescens]QJU39313.1 DUF4214 domain-containing protein [Serratia marcescens]
MSSLVSQQTGAALYYAVLGKAASAATFDSAGQLLENGGTSAQYVAQILSSSAGQALYSGKSTSDIVSAIYTNVYGSAPSAGVLAALLAGGQPAANIVGGLVSDLLNYNGFDSTILSQQTAFDNKIDAVLYPSANTAAAAGNGASDVLAIYYVLGSVQSAAGVNYWGAAINDGSRTFSVAAQSFVNERSYINTLSNQDFITKLFTQGFKRPPDSTELNTYLTELQGGATRGDVIVDFINSLRGSVSSSDAAAKQAFTLATTAYTAGSLPGLNYQEQAAAVFLAVPERGIDAVGLDSWSKYLASGAAYTKFITSALASDEFQRKGAQLTGDNFIQHVYTAVHGTAATPAQLALYSALGTDKSVITQAIINDLRTSTATDAVTVTQQHAFEFDIGTSLLYKTAASLTTTAAGGNATGTVNTGISHQISNAETAVLTNVQLNANAASTVNLKFADHLANLTINGTSAATVNLSDNGVNPGVDITVNNGNVILNASSGNDDVIVTSTANIATGTGDFNLGNGNDSLKWAGNAATGAANTVGAGISANGGAGVDTISANFITKNVNITGTLVKNATISSNAAQFTNFEKIDLAGYVGKATVTGGTSTAVNHTFDFGVLTGNASLESSTGVLTTTQAPTSNIGSQGFVLSGLAEAVKVINAAGGTSAQLEVTGNATSASSVDITFLQNATNHFDVNFTATSAVDVNAGSLSLNSSSSLIGGTALTNLNIASGGTGNFDNILSLTGTNAQVQNIAVSGDHILDLTVGSGFSNVRDINASTNTAGLNLDSSHGGTGDGIIIQLLNILPLSVVTTNLLAPVLSALGLNGYQLTVEGSSAADTLGVIGNTTLTGGAGANIYDIKASNTQAGVTIKDFSSLKDKIVDVNHGGLTISNDASGTAVADYGTRSADTLDALLGTLVGGLTNGVIGLLGGILGLDSSNSLTSKVGVASVVFSGGGNTASSYVIIDNNDNHALDLNDTVVYLTGQNHQQLVDTLHYA